MQLYEIQDAISSCEDEMQNLATAWDLAEGEAKDEIYNKILDLEYEIDELLALEAEFV